MGWYNDINDIVDNNKQSTLHYMPNSPRHYSFQRKSSRALEAIGMSVRIGLDYLIPPKNVEASGTVPLNVAFEKSKPGFSIFKRSRISALRTSIIASESIAS